MTRIPWKGLLLLCISGLFGASFETIDGFELELSQYELQNGLQVVLAPDDSTPLVSVAVTYDVGSRCDPIDESGLAHLVEHLMFRGSKSVEPGQHTAFVRSVGGILNASTNAERTSYYQSIPSNYLSDLLHLEADRMAGLEITRFGFSKALSVVADERRRGIGRNPTRFSRIKAKELALQDFRYGHATIGEPSDLLNIDVNDAQEFWHNYYGPNNAVLVIVGRIDVQRVRRLVDRYFSGIPMRGSPSDCVRGTAQLASLANEQTVYHNRTSGSIVTVCFKVAPVGMRDWFSVALAGDIIADGHFSLLRNRLDRSGVSVREVSWSIDHRRESALGTIQVELTRSSDLMQANRILNDLLKRYSRKVVPTHSIRLAKLKWSRTVAQSLRRSYYRAVALGDATILQGSPSRMLAMISSYHSVSSSEIRDSIASYLDPGTAAVLYTLPQESQ